MEKDDTRVHEHYLRHLLLLAVAAPVPLRAIVLKAVKDRGLKSVVLEAKFTFKTLFSQQYLKLFPGGNVNADLNSWDTHLLCTVVCLLFASVLSETVCDAISCILEQVNDLDNYAASAALDYDTYETKWKHLHEALLHLLTTTDSNSKYECTLLIQSFAKEPIQVNMKLIHKLKETRDVGEQLEMAIKYHVSKMFDIDDETETEIEAGVQDEISDKTESPTLFVIKLHNESVCENEKIILMCETNNQKETVKWYKDSDRLEETGNISFSMDGCRHGLQISAAGFQDTGIYSCLSSSGEAITSAFVKVQELPTAFLTPLQDTNVYENEKVVLMCKANSGERTVKWFKSSDRLEETENTSFSQGGLRHGLEVSAAGLQDTGVYSCLFTSGEAFTSACFHVQALPVSFTSTLHDMAVCENMRILFECDFNTDIKEVKWYNFSERLTQTDRILITHDSCHHSLEITAADVQDTGIYSCLSGDTLTSAFVNVKELPVEFIECLSDKEVLEGEDISLSCKVNESRKTPIWFHDGKKIETFSVRKNIASNGNEHKLTILNAKLYDEGNYKIEFGNKSSEAILTVGDNSDDLYKKQLTKQNYRNWVRGALGLLFLKQGLMEFANKCMTKQYGMFIQNVPTPASQCTHCSFDTLMPCNNHTSNKKCHKRNCLCSKKPKPPNKRVVCPNGGFCSKIYDLMLADHRHADPCLANADIPAWISDPWSVGTCFVNTPGYKSKTSAHEIDCSGLLSIFINNVFFNKELGDVNINGKTDLFKQARDARNEILHNPNYELSESEFNMYINLFKAVLEVRNVVNKKPLETEPGTAEALENLKRLQNYQIDIDEDVNRTTKAIKDQKIIDSLGKAKKENDEKITKLKETLKEKEERIQFLRQVRNYQPTEKTTMFQVAFYVRLVILGSSKVKHFNDKILEGMRSFLENLEGTQSLEGTNIQQSDLDIAVGTLVNSLVTLSDVHVSLADDSSLKVCVSTNDGLNEFVTLMNGSLLQQNVYQLRRCIGQAIGESVVVETSITSESLTAARTQLSTKGILCDKHGDFKCTKHRWMQNVWYCVEHEEFCCSLCKTDEHRSCKGMRKVLSEITESEVGNDHLVVQQMKEYDIRKGGFYTGDKETCSITGICVLPSGEILLADNGNERLKKLNRSFKLVSHCDLPAVPYDMCFIGNDVAALCFYYPIVIQFVDVSGNMRLRHQIKLKFRCLHLACHGDILYLTCKNTVYTCKTDGSQVHDLYTCPNDVMDIAISDDGEKIYIASGNETLLTIDNKGNHLSILKLYDYSFKRVCTVGDKSVLVYDDSGNNVYRVDIEGNRILGTVVSSSDLNKVLKTLCFDRQHCRLVVGYVYCDKIAVFEFK